MGTSTKKKASKPKTAPEKKASKPVSKLVSKPVAKAVAKKPAPKAPAKAVAVKKVVVAKKSAAKAQKTVAPKKSAPAKAVVTKKPSPVKTPVAAKAAPVPAPVPAPVKKKQPSSPPLYPMVKTAAQTKKLQSKKELPRTVERFTDAELLDFKRLLLDWAEDIRNKVGSMKDSALKGTEDDNPEEDGTDAIMRLNTLAEVHTHQETLAKINEALKAIERGTYGICDHCGQLIRQQRLQAQPFSKTCIKCQTELERARKFE